MFRPRPPAGVALSVSFVIVAALPRLASAVEFQCGGPDAGDCCTANGTPHCEDPECCKAICAIDPFCCDLPWDEICAEEAVEFCSVCGAACGAPAAGACCEANATAGCEDTTCCANVCLFASFCCVGEWDAGCAELAFVACPALCCPQDLDGSGQVGPFDLALLLGGWGSNPGHPADFDGDGDVAPPDLAILLNEWGPCW